MKKTRSSRYSDEIKSQAKTLYLASLTPLEIKTKLDINSVRTVYNWINDGGWNALLTVYGAEQQLEVRLQQLTGREKKTKLELDEIDRLVTNIVKMRTANAKLRDQEVSVRAREQALKEGNDTPAAGDGNSRSTKKPRKRKNDLPDVDDPRWQQWIDGLWGYQKIHFDAKELRERWTLKGRQVGFTRSEERRVGKECRAGWVRCNKTRRKTSSRTGYGSEHLRTLRRSVMGSN